MRERKKLVESISVIDMVRDMVLIWSEILGDRVLRQ